MNIQAAMAESMKNLEDDVSENDAGEVDLSGEVVATTRAASILLQPWPLRSKRLERIRPMVRLSVN